VDENADPPIQDRVIEAQSPAYSLRQLVAYFLGLGTYGFGGPVALVGYMHRDLVERRAWIAEADYREGMALAQLAPGPLAAQLAIYLGFVHYRILGATLVGVAFVLPSFFMVLALGWAYVLYGGLPWMRAAFYGVGAAVIGIIAYSAYKLTRKTIGRDRLLWLVYLANAIATVITESELVWLVLVSGLAVWTVRTRPRIQPAAAIFLPLGASVSEIPAATSQTLWQIAVFFTQAGAFVFGSGLAIIPFLYGGVVTEYGWLNDDQFLDAVAVAMITPGPVVITVAFIGFLVAGFSGASLAAVATFLPCYLFTIIPAPYFKKYGKRPGIVAFVDGVTAAAIGAISGAVIVLGQRMIVEHGEPDMFNVSLMLITLAVISSGRRIPEPLIVLAAAVIGLVAYPMLH
jgi:chromate transporter